MKNYKNLYLKNQGIISILDMMTMGDSEKREDDSKIGRFDSGLKYAISILSRHGTKIEIFSNGDLYTFGTTIVRDEKTSKVKELITVQRNEEEPLTTAFALTLGDHWDYWMAIRELYSNCLDMGGQRVITVDSEDFNDDTVVKVYGDSNLQNVLDNWGEYFLQDIEPLYTGSTVKIYQNDSDYLKIYKQGILIFSDKKLKSQFKYSVEFAPIDEKRELNDRSYALSAIGDTITNCSDKNFISKYFINQKEDEVISSIYFWGSLSKQWIEVVNNFCEDNNSFYTYSDILDLILKDKRFKTGVRKMTEVARYSNPTVEVREVKLIEEQKISWEDSIKNICSTEGFIVSYPLLKSQIDKRKCIGDPSEKIIYVDENFNREDVWEIVKAQYSIESYTDPNKIYKDFLKRTI